MRRKFMKLKGKVAILTGAGRSGEPEDILNATLFLANDDSEYKILKL